MVATSEQSPWFSVAPDRWRQAVVAPLASRLDEAPANVAFLLARGATLAVFVTVALWLAWQAQRSAEPAQWLKAAFLTLAWFWTLSPTVNPWYWPWMLTLLPFARGRAWFAVSGLLLLYYLRFWLAYHFTDTRLFGTGCHGEHFFHFMVCRWSTDLGRDGSWLSPGNVGSVSHWTEPFWWTAQSEGCNGHPSCPTFAPTS